MKIYDLSGRAIEVYGEERGPLSHTGRVNEIAEELASMEMELVEQLREAGCYVSEVGGEINLIDTPYVKYPGPGDFPRSFYLTFEEDRMHRIKAADAVLDLCEIAETGTTVLLSSGGRWLIIKDCEFLWSVDMKDWTNQLPSVMQRLEQAEVGSDDLYNEAQNAAMRIRLDLLMRAAAAELDGRIEHAEQWRAIADELWAALSRFYGNPTDLEIYGELTALIAAQGER